MCFRHAPTEYGAIHFHEDDIDDCNWPTTFQWKVPDGTRSSVYALLLSAGATEENVPFHVVPPKGRATADIAVLASTFTYTIYGNHARPEWDRDPKWQAAWREQVPFAPQWLGRVQGRPATGPPSHSKNASGPVEHWHPAPARSSQAKSKYPSPLLSRLSAIHASSLAT